MIFKLGGMSLLEVLIALMLIGSGALGLIKMQAYVESKADFAKRSIEALYMAESKLESFTQRGGTAAKATFTYQDILHDTCVSVSHCVVKVDGFQTQCQVFPESTLSDALSLIKVEVCWWDRFGEKQSVELTSAISRYSEFE